MSMAGAVNLEAGVNRKLLTSVTIFALVGSGLIENHRLVGNLACFFMTIQAGHVDVRTIEGVGRLFVVVKLRRFPTCRVMTT